MWPIKSFKVITKDMEENLLKKVSKYISHLNYLKCTNFLDTVIYLKVVVYSILYAEKKKAKRIKEKPKIKKGYRCKHKLDLKLDIIKRLENSNKKHQL